MPLTSKEKLQAFIGVLLILVSVGGCIMYIKQVPSLERGFVTGWAAEEPAATKDGKPPINNRMIGFPWLLRESVIIPFHVFQMALGITFAVIARWWVVPKGKKVSLRRKRLGRELVRKSFHLCGGTLISGGHYLALRFNWCVPGYLLLDKGGAIDFARGFAPFVVLTWTLDFLRVVLPGLNSWLFSIVGSLARETEREKATGMSYFLPGALFASLLYQPDIAIIAIMFLSMGDAAAGLGTAVGTISVPNTVRKVEGTVGMFIVCFVVACFVIDGDAIGVPHHLLICSLSAAWVSICELWAEVMRVDDNLFVPVVGAFGLQILKQQLPGIGQMRMI